MPSGEAGLLEWGWHMEKLQSWGGACTEQRRLPGVVLGALGAQCPGLAWVSLLVCRSACLFTSPLWQSLHSLQQAGRWHEGKSGFGVKMSGEDCGKLESAELPKAGEEGAVPAQLQRITALRTHGWTRVWQIFKFFFFSEKSYVWNFGVTSILKKKENHLLWSNRTKSQITEGGFVLWKL